MKGEDRRANVEKNELSSLTSSVTVPYFKLPLRGCEGERREARERERGPVGPGGTTAGPRPPSYHTRRPSSPGAPSVLGQVLTRGAERQCDGGYCSLGDLPKCNTKSTQRSFHAKALQTGQPQEEQCPAPPSVLQAGGHCGSFNRRAEHSS